MEWHFLELGWAHGACGSSSLLLLQVFILSSSESSDDEEEDLEDEDEDLEWARTLAMLGIRFPFRRARLLNCLDSN